jgi:hypothetical protein
VTGNVEDCREVVQFSVAIAGHHFSSSRQRRCSRASGGGLRSVCTARLSFLSCSGASVRSSSGLITANQVTAALALFGLSHVSKSAGTPDNIIADLRNLPSPVCLHKFGIYDTACDKKVFWIVRAGPTTLPHVHSDEIGTNCRLIALYRDIVPGQKMLRSFKTSEALLVACADFFWSDQRCSIRTRHFGLCRKDRGKTLCVKSLLIECAKIAMHHTRDFRLVD